MTIPWSPKRLLAFSGFLPAARILISLAYALFRSIKTSMRNDPDQTCSSGDQQLFFSSAFPREEQAWTLFSHHCYTVHILSYSYPTSARCFFPSFRYALKSSRSSFVVSLILRSDPFAKIQRLSEINHHRVRVGGPVDSIFSVNAFSYAHRSFPYR